MRSVLIIGGTRGIGAAIARRFAAPENTIFLNYSSDDDRAREISTELIAAGANVHLVKADIGDIASVRAMLETIGRLVSRIDVLVHCAAVVDHGKIVDQDPERFERSLRIGGMSLFYVVKHAASLLSEGSSVIFLSGNAVDIVLPNHGALAAGKAVGECLVRYLAIECAPAGIAFNTLRVGPIDTDLFRAAVGTTPGKAAPLPPVTPAGRRLTVDDAADAAYFLASPEAFMMRGQTLMLDGGLSKTVR